MYIHIIRVFATILLVEISPIIVANSFPGEFFYRKTVDLKRCHEKEFAPTTNMGPFLKKEMKIKFYYYFIHFFDENIIEHINS